MWSPNFELRGNIIECACKRKTFALPECSVLLECPTPRVLTRRVARQAAGRIRSPVIRPLVVRVRGTVNQPPGDDVPPSFDFCQLCQVAAICPNVPLPPRAERVPKVKVSPPNGTAALPKPN